MIIVEINVKSKSTLSWLCSDTDSKCDLNQPFTYVIAGPTKRDKIVRVKKKKFASVQNDDHIPRSGKIV